MIGTVILRFNREGVMIQPLQKLFAKCANHLCLRIVNVSIDKARHDQSAAQVDDRMPHQHRLAIFPAIQPHYASITQQQHCILKIAGLAGQVVGTIHHAGKVKEAGAYRRVGC